MGSSKLAQLQTGKEYTINGVKFTFRSLEVDDKTAALMQEEEGASIEKKMPLIKELVLKMVKDSEPDATEEELQECMRMKNLIPLVEAFYDVNGMTDQENLEKAEKVKNALKQAQERRRPK